MLRTENEVKCYDHIVPLGLNCEIAHRIRKNHGFVESWLLTWAAVPARSLTQVLRNNKLIFSGSLQHNASYNMFECGVTKIGFHGSRKPAELLDGAGVPDPELVDRERTECINRIRHLCEKTSAIAGDNSAKLYCVGLHPNYLKDFSGEIGTLINEIWQVLAGKAKNASLLAIVENSQYVALRNLSFAPEVYIRSIKHFAPHNKATTDEYSDCEGYVKIFSEFRPATNIKDTKKYKYEQL